MIPGGLCGFLDISRPKDLMAFLFQRHGQIEADDPVRLDEQSQHSSSSPIHIAARSGLPDRNLVGLQDTNNPMVNGVFIFLNPAWAGSRV